MISMTILKNRIMRRRRGFAGLVNPALCLFVAACAAPSSLSGQSGLDAQQAPPETYFSISKPEGSGWQPEAEGANVSYLKKIQNDHTAIAFAMVVTVDSGSQGADSLLQVHETGIKAATGPGNRFFPYSETQSWQAINGVQCLEVIFSTRDHATALPSDMDGWQRYCPLNDPTESLVLMMGYSQRRVITLPIDAAVEAEAAAFWNSLILLEHR